MNRNVKDKIYIPERIKNVQISSLPISAELVEFFNENKIQIIGDLQKIGIEASNQIIDSRRKPFPELRHYILAFQESENNEVILISNQKVQEQERLNKQNESFEAILTKTIFIPMPARNWKISTLPVSQKLIEKIEKSGCSKLYDLHGVNYSMFFKLKSFEKTNVIQLYAFITQLQSEKTFPSIEALIAKSYSEEKAEEADTKTISVVENNASNEVVSAQNANPSKQLEQAKYFKSTKTIQIPLSLVKFPIDDLAPSDKLANLLKEGRIFQIGHLKGMSYYDLKQRLKLDAEDVSELQSLIAFAKEFAKYTMFKSGFETIKRAALKRRENEQALKKTSEHTTDNRSDTNGGNVNTANRRNYFEQIAQKRIGEEQTNNVLNAKFSPEPQEFNLPELMVTINKFTDNLPQTEREIFLARFGGTPDEQILTHREIGEKLQITTENAYQKYLKVINNLKSNLEKSAENVLKKIYDDCLSAVCPLMPKFLVFMVKDDYKLFQYPAAFYIRIFGFLMPEIPILSEIENQVVMLKDEAGKIEKDIETFLGAKHLPVSLSQMFNHLMTFRTNRKTAESDFFKAVQSVRFNLITTDKPNELFIELKNQQKIDCKVTELIRNCVTGADLDWI